MKEFDEIANLFPMGPEDELKELAASIGASGLEVAIVLRNGKILDGRRRARACKMAGVEPRYEELPAGKDPYEFVAAMNLHRRHLNKRQCAEISEAIADMVQGGTGANQFMKEQRRRSTSLQIGIRQAAKLMNVSPAMIDRVRYIKKNAVPEVVEAMKEDRITVDAAKKIARLPKEEQVQALDDKRNNKKPIRRKSVAQKTHLSQEQIEELEARINAPSIYPDEAPLPVHPDGNGKTEHVREAITLLRKKEPQIREMNQKQLWNDVWTYTQRIQSFTSNAGREQYVIKDADPRWSKWAGHVALKVRAQQALLEAGRITQRRTYPKTRFSKWTQAIKKLLHSFSFAAADATELIATTVQTIEEDFAQLQK
jgi:hypothetical protein